MFQRNWRNLAKVGALVVSGLLVAGCTAGSPTAGGPTAENANNQPNANGTTNATATPSNGTESSRPEWIPGPLDAFRIRIWGLSAFWDQGDPIEMARESDAQHVAREDAIAACMLAQGFEYIPFVITTVTLTVRLAHSFRKARGNGRKGLALGTAPITWPGGGTVAVGTRLETDQEMSRLRTEMESQMSQAELRAFDLALSGDPDYIEELMRDGDWVPPQTREEALVLGCENYVSWQEAQLPDQFTGIGDLVLNEFPRMLAADPRSEQLNRDWAACMSGVGFPEWGSPGAASQGVADIVWGNVEPFDIEAVMTWDWDAYPDGPPPPAEPVNLQAMERTVAVADWDCRQAVDYGAVMEQINLDVQQQFVDQHWLALEDWARAVEAGEVTQGATGQMMGLQSRRRWN